MVIQIVCLHSILALSFLKGKRVGNVANLRSVDSEGRSGILHKFIFHVMDNLGERIIPIRAHDRISSVVLFSVLVHRVELRWLQQVGALSVLSIRHLE